MIESFLCATWIGGQVLYWSFLKHQTALQGEEYWRMLKSLIRADFRCGYRHPGPNSTMQD